jgi:hypothetical protein
MTLDPTPSSDDSIAERSWFGDWLESARTNLGSFFRYFIVEYDSDQQGRARSWLSGQNWSAAHRLVFGPTGGEWWRPLILAFGLVGVFLGVRRWRRGARPQLKGSDPTVALHTRMLEIIQKWFGLSPQPGQTPAEFARFAAGRLQTLADPALPADTVVVYYRVRYGAQPISDSERSGLARRIDLFESDLGRFHTA